MKTRSHEQDQAVDARVRADIVQHGFHLALFPAAGSAPGWAHSIGLWQRFAHPELVVFGPELELPAQLLRRLCLEVRAGRHYQGGESPAGILQGRAPTLQQVAARWLPVFMGNAAWHYRSEEFPVLQAFWPDPGGAFPWQAHADPEWREAQPLLYESAIHLALSEDAIDMLRKEGAL